MRNALISSFVVASEVMCVYIEKVDDDGYDASFIVKHHLR